MSDAIKCYFSLGGLNYKNGFATSCPQQSDQLFVLTDTIKPSEIINTEKFKQHRLDMKSGKWPAGCHLCKEVEEASAGKSMRHDYDVSSLNYSNDGAISFKDLKHVELRFSNSCNLACLHCSEVYSSGWMSKLKNYQPDQEDYTHNLIQLTKRMHREGDNDDLSIGISTEQMLIIVQDLIDNFPNLEKVDFAGGEVLYQKQFFPCLEKLAEHPNASNIKLFFHSNFNAKFDPVRLHRLLQPFGSSTIMISVDGGRKIYPYFRTANWDILTANINKFKELDLNKKTLIKLVCTTSVYQVMEIVDVFESLLTLDVDRINSSIVYTPRYLNPALMMQRFSKNVLEDIELAKLAIDKEKQRRLADPTKYRSWVRDDAFSDIYTAYLALDNIKNYITNHKTKEEELTALEVYIKKTDAIWKQSFNDYFTNYNVVDGILQRI